jgi:hypothetical protein
LNHLDKENCHSSDLDEAIEILSRLIDLLMISDNYMLNSHMGFVVILRNMRSILRGDLYG